ncbi:SRPBCC domain-containing protein [Aerococcaceae bacterium DSM 111020]|nr:SRPBCC domain-containing protein [Aerococcaceae bacterium DSM 111020]
MKDNNESVSHHHDHDGCGHDHHSPLEDVTHHHGREIRLEAEVQAPVEQIWAVLTDNDKIKEWFNELHINELQAGGSISFILDDEEIARYLITDLEEPHELSFTWGESGDHLVTFHLKELSENQSLLQFEEWVPEVTEHTVRDIAGWYVCIEVIGQIVEGRAPIDRPQHFLAATKEIEALLNSDSEV